MSDAGQNFTRVVPQRAFEFSILFHAIMALSALQLNRLNGEDISIADSHYHKCLSEMIPILGQQDLAADGKVLAATVLLRMFEMLKDC